jgi:membrane-bound lytic murein transglycosylase D
VRRGETLTSIAAKHGTTVSKLKKLNGLKSDKIRYGQRIKVR